jgi:hypothetical protein
MADSDSESVPFWWTALFLLLALGLAAIAIRMVGGSLISGAFLPVPF